MSTNPLTRQQIYDRIRQTSKPEYILSEMQRLGFWPKSDGMPSLPELLIKKEGELERELSALLEEKRRYEDRGQALIEMRKKRMEEAKKKRALTREKRAAALQEKAERWQQRKDREIIYLGEGVSGGLNQGESNAALLQSKGLPHFPNEEELARSMGISLPELRFLSYHRAVSTTTHYKRFGLRKKSGGMRIISAPMPRLKEAQYWVLHHVLNKLSTHEAAHGFVAQRSILTNAAQHLAKDVVVNIDLKDFFPSVSFKRVKGLFVKLGYAEKMATILALLCTEPEVEEVELDGQTYYIAQGARALPQGAPTSPAITNILCYRLDCRLRGVARAMGFTFTRYADDITFSGGREVAGRVDQLLWRLKRIIREEGFAVHPQKIKVMRKGARQEVTGIVVNQQPGINRETLRRFRALLHSIQKDGFAGKQWKGGNLVPEIIGYANFVAMVKPALGARLKAQVQQILQTPAAADYLRVNPLPPAVKSTPPATTVEPSIPAPPAKDAKPWWDVL